MTGWSARKRTGSPDGGICSAPRKHPFAGQLTVAAALQRLTVQPYADPVALAADGVLLRRQQSPRLLVEPVAARPLGEPDLQPLGRRLGDGGEVGVGKSRDEVADGQPVAGRHRGGPQPAEHVGGARAEHGLDREATPHRDVGAQPGHRGPEPQHVSGSQPHRSVVGRAGASGTGGHDHHLVLRAQHQTTEGHLEGGSAGVVAEEPVGEAVRRPVTGARAADPDRGAADPALVLHRGQRTRLLDDQVPGHGSTATNRTRVSGESTAGGSRSRSNGGRSVRPISCQPPGDSRG